jgi:hypothetical protein
MSIRTAGGDTHVWDIHGHTHGISGRTIVGVPADKAADYNAILYEMITGERIRTRNPGEWEKVSKQKAKEIAKREGLSKRWSKVKKSLEEAGIKVGSGDGLSIVFYSGNGQYESEASFSINTGNAKTGPGSASNVSQGSCPNGKNNKSGYRCPLLGTGCYAEEGSQGTWVTKRLNDFTNVAPRENKIPKISPEKLAEAEALALKNAYLTWTLAGLNNGVRLHVVGDCVTPAAARTVNKAVEEYVREYLQGSGVRADKLTKNVWNYTHAWRDVPRSAWSPNISVLASCDTVDQLEEATAKGYGCAVVVPDYVQESLDKETGKATYSRKAFTAPNGFKLIPCPHEVQDKNGNNNNRVWCLECGLCMKDDWLRQNKAAIAFAAHTSGAQKVANELFKIVK